MSQAVGAAHAGPLGWLRIPGALIAANWVGLLGVLMLIAAVPAFAGNQRIAALLRDDADEAGATVWRQLRLTWRRDLPVTAAFWIYSMLGIASLAVLTQVFGPGERVLFAGALVPVYWVGGALLGCYIRAAAIAPIQTHRPGVVAVAIELAATHPVRALLTVPVVVATSPVWSLLPFAIAAGLSVPAWALNAVWTLPRPSGPATT